MKWLLAVAILAIFSTGCSMTGGFGKATDEALVAQIPYEPKESQTLMVSAETFQILKDGFNESEAYQEIRPQVLETLGGITMWFKFLEHDVSENQSLSYSTFVTGYNFLHWLYMSNLSQQLGPLVLEGELSDARDSLIYYLTSESIKESLYEMGMKISLAEKDIRAKASANDAAELRKLYKKFTPFIKILSPGLGGLGDVGGLL